MSKQIKTYNQPSKSNSFKAVIGLWICVCIQVEENTIECFSFSPNYQTLTAIAQPTQTIEIKA